MPVPRFRIRTLMIAVAAVAVTIAAWQMFDLIIRDAVERHSTHSGEDVDDFAGPSRPRLTTPPATSR